MNRPLRYPTRLTCTQLGTSFTSCGLANAISNDSQDGLANDVAKDFMITDFYRSYSRNLPHQPAHCAWLSSFLAYVLITVRKVTPSTSAPTILLNGTPIKIVTEMRVLGVIVDNKLSWSPHVESIISKVCRKIGILQRNKHQLTHFARRLFYLAIIHPDLEYAAVSTVPFMSASLRGRLCSVWRRAIRCIAGADWQADVAPILKNHRLTHIEHRWALQIALVTRRCIQRSAPLTLCKKLTFTDHSHRTRGSGNSLRPFRPSSRPGTLFL